MYKGIPGSEGIGIGKIYIFKEQTIEIDDHSVSDTALEISRMENAMNEFVTITNEMANKMEETVGSKDADILRGHIMLLQDPSLKEQMTERINSGATAERAVNNVFEETAAMFAQIPDELLQQRSTDFIDIKTRVLKILMGIEELDISQLPKGTVLVAKDLTPSMTAGIIPENIAGILTEVGGPTSHSAILARAMEIPAVLSIEKIIDVVKDGDAAVLDGSNGELYINPSDEIMATFQKKQELYLKEKESLKIQLGKETTTACGDKRHLVCNIGKPSDIDKVIECDGEGVGLFRTEFLFMDTDKLPSEEDQFIAYKKVATAMKGKPIIIRTLDIGGDKEIPYLGLEKEENPFLGFRAIRFCLGRQDIYMTQLRALVRASAFGDIKIMVPLVTGVEELRSVREMVKEIMSDFDSNNISYDSNLEIGVMMETPAACMMADVLAKEADFFSIGTNDLTGYTMAVDRGNAKVAYLYSTYNPAVLRSIHNIITCGKKENIMVGMCGEAAADPKLIPVLLGFGLDEFSVSATSVLKTRKNISQYDLDECRSLAKKVLACGTEKEVLALLG